MHTPDLETGMLGANGIVGGGPPLVCGVGLSAKVRGTKQVGVSFTGDGGSNQGTFLESLNLAGVWGLPCVFVVENNGYAEATSSEYHQSGVDVAKRADGFGLPGVVVDGHDYFAVHEVAGEAIRRAREGGEGVRARRDCLDAFRRRLTSAGVLDEDELDLIDAEVAQLIEDAV